MQTHTKSTHRFAFRCGTAGLSNTDWTRKIIKNGVVSTTVNVEVQNIDNANLYCATFSDDGTDKAYWTVVLVNGTDVFTQHFYMTHNTVQENVNLIRVLLAGLQRSIEGMLIILRSR